MNKACFGKNLEDVRGRIDLKASFDKTYLVKYMSLPSWKGNTRYGEGEKHFVVMEMGKKKVKLDSAYAGSAAVPLPRPARLCTSASTSCSPTAGRRASSAASSAGCRRQIRSGAAHRRQS